MKEKKGFFSRLFEKLDNNLEKKAKEKPCCCNGPCETDKELSNKKE